ncbi:glycoside hydrolase family 9 protein [Rhizobiaceae bacterium BDR2-2]|uniref:Glycoside hydrolase family 9 protein n=1 Tax=Ectorhizobium quercum TaxID=2965071 RepID=A0AAE3MVT5_9HYPH|nr:glycoside hydrolase family 9 protein [Ectorhizobium quercum]MCX8995863.1 glycoside hydrolase family 9 protein [Ectorhizobium quercum]
MKHFLILCLSLHLLCPAFALASPPPDPALHVHDITMAAPDIIAVEIHDSAFLSGEIVELDRPRPEAVGTWVFHENRWGLVIGPQRRHLRMSDVPPDRFLERAAFDRPDAYRIDGDNRVVAVYRKSMPRSSGLYRGDGGTTQTGASFRHMLYLKLDRALETGPHRIAWPQETFPATDFAFDPLTTRALAIRATQIGHRSHDLGKAAYLALWLPGGPDHGAVNFRTYGIEAFSVVDASGREVFSAPIRLRSGPADPEPANGLPSPLVDYADGTPQPVEDFQPGEPPRITAPGHGLRDGTRVLLERMGGEQDASGLLATVAEADADTFALVDLDGPIPQTAAAGATFTSTHRSNRAGTFVFELDYSDWVPAASGEYRLHIDGLGVSDTFTVSDDRWMALARNGFAGLYNHRSGIPLDGRFGFTRPAAFRPGPDMAIAESKLPLSWTSNWPGGFISFEQGPKPDWVTGRTVPDDYWGGYMDAGDWDRRIQHLVISDAFIDLFERLPPEKRTVSAGIPKSGEVLPHPAYRDADSLPDLLHEAIWNVDFYRRLQMPDGSIRGGIESSEHPMPGSTSFLEHLPVYAYAPDHIATYRYAASAARLARVLRDAGQPALADLFRASALHAWDAAERATADPDAFYADAIAAATKAGAFNDVPWEERKAALQDSAGDFRVAAAASLFRLEGEASHAEIVEEAWRGGWDLYLHKGDAAWDYHQSANADPAIRTAIGETILRESELLLSAQSSLAYPSMKHPYAPAGWGQGGPPDFGQTQLLFRAYQLNGNPAIIRLMEQTMHGLHGANQLGLSFTTGIGVRGIEHPLHEDHRSMGIPVPPGITIYGWAPQSASAYGWVFGPEWSPLAEVGPERIVATRRIEPHRFTLPFFEYLVEHPAVIIQQEYTVDQAIGPVTFIALFLDSLQ